MEDINLNDWRWLRKIDGNDQVNLEAYIEMARKNEALVVEVNGEYSYNIYIPERKKPTTKEGSDSHE